MIANSAPVALFFFGELRLGLSISSMSAAVHSPHKTL